MAATPLICVWPRATRAVSVTGPACALNCAHCGGRYLEAMADLRAPAPWLTEEGAGAGGRGQVKSLLVSGGCTPGGMVPLAGEAGRLRHLRQRFRLNAHPGLVDESGAAALAGWADVASLDFVADAATLREVYGLDARPERYLEALRALRARLPVVPHVCLGLKGGEIGAEYEALAHLAAEGVEALAVLVFVPTPGTRYADRQAPPAAEVGAFLASARRALPGALLTLGCMRPRGRYREVVDVAAVEAGVDAIVQPAPAARKLAVAQGRRLIRYEECCAFLSVPEHA